MDLNVFQQLVAGLIVSMLFFLMVIAVLGVLMVAWEWVSDFWR